MSVLRIALRLSCFLILVVALIPAQAVLVFVPRLWTIIPLWFHRILLRVMGVRLAMTGPLPKPGTLIVANHLSWFDIVVIGAVLPLSFIAKKEVKSYPLFGQLARLQRTVFVDRRRGRHNIKDGTILAKRLAAGHTMLIFAEGTNSDGIKVLPFKSTLFAGITGAAHIPVQAMSMAYTRAHDMAMGRRQRMAYAWLGEVSLIQHLFFMLAGPPITVELLFHEELPDRFKGDRKEMTLALFGQVSGGLQAITAGVPRPLAAAAEKR